MSTQLSSANVNANGIGLVTTFEMDLVAALHGAVMAEDPPESDPCQ